MAYPPPPSQSQYNQRPPLEHQGDSSFSGGGGSAYDPERGLSANASANSLSSAKNKNQNKLRKPSSTGWGLHGKNGGDPAQGEYLELNPTGSLSPTPGAGHAGHHHHHFNMEGGGYPYDLRLPDGEVPKTKVGKLYSYLISVSIVTRWILFIVPILGIIWIPGILSLTSFPNARVWGVKLIWWSIWLSVLWGGWWAALAIARIAPSLIRATVGIVAISTRRYIDWLQALHRYIALFIWTLAVWISYNPLISVHQANSVAVTVSGGNITSTTTTTTTTTSRSEAAVALIGKLLFSFLLCAALLLFEKFSIQYIAGKFHERSYAERIADQKFAVSVLVTLYRNSTDIPGRSDTLGHANAREAVAHPKRLFRKLREGVRFATTTTATVFGNVASEIAGSSVLQPNSPQAVIKTSLESTNKSRLLARRLFYSFTQNKSDYLLLEDIERFFPDREAAIAAFNLFDKDGNGDVSRDEVEMACLEFHREQLSIENSMRDLDSAVGRLDNILMSVYVIIAALIIAVGLEAQLATLVTGAGTLILGLSWLIGGSLQEVLTSIIFLFVKHPFDVGDRVVLNKETYTVKEIRLLSTVFLDSNSGLVQAPNNQLNSLFIQNIRRSPQMSETFTFDVAYSTTFEDLEKLRARMMEFVTAERRDYQTTFDVKVKDFPDQAKMTLSADIQYKSNGQQAALKAKRRNKWICALKTILGELKIYGPSGDPSPPPPVSRYTAVPWDLIQAQDRKDQKISHPADEQMMPPRDGWKLSDKNAEILDNEDDVFGDSAEATSHDEPETRTVTGRRRRYRENDSITVCFEKFCRPGPRHPADVFEMRR